MLLPTMTPQEKCAQMEYIYYYMLGIPAGKRKAIFKKVSKSKVFPFFITEEAEIPNMGKWVIVYEAESKTLIRKGILSVRAYQKYYIKYAKDPLNIGTGIFLFSSGNNGQISCEEFPPHYFNRIRERLVEPKGIVQPSFPQLVKIVMKLHHRSMDTVIKGCKIRKGTDGKYSFEFNDEYDRKEGYCNIISYHHEGISLGISMFDKSYINFTTFIPNSLLRESQLEEQKKCLRQLKEYEYKIQLDPSYVFNKCDIANPYDINN